MGATVGTVTVPCVAINIPGVPGQAGAAGTNGTNGLNAFTTLTAPFTMPANLGSGIASVVNSTWMAIGQPVFIGFLGVLKVTALPTATSVTLQNLRDGNTPSNAYRSNADAGTAAPPGSGMMPSGWQGVTGLIPGGALLTVNNLSDLVSAGAARGNLGLVIGVNVQAFDAGLQSLSALPTAADKIAYSTALDVWAQTALTAFARGVLAASDAATARTLLGLLSMAIQDANAVNILGGSMVNVNVGALALTVSGDAKLDGKVFIPPLAIQSLLAASTIQANAGKARVAGNGGAVILTSTPTITAGTADGQSLLILGTDNTNTVTVQSNATLPGSTINLGAGTRVLGAGDQLLVNWDATSGRWNEVGFSNN